MGAIANHAYPSVGVKLLDRDHDQLTESLNEIQFWAAAGLAGGRPSEMLRKLAQRMQLHFALEEGMMLATRYPGTAIHRLQHQWLIDQVVALAHQRGREAVVRNTHLMQLLVTSHHRHMGNEDFNYGLWLNATGARSTDAAAGAGPIEA